MIIKYTAESQALAEKILQERAEKPVRKIKVPKVLAVVDQAGCTGCEACIQFCPVDSIELVPGPNFPDMGKFVEIDLDRCIGCKACAKHCPWDTITMIDSGEAYDTANDWTLRTVLNPAGFEAPAKSIWPLPAAVPENSGDSSASDPSAQS